MHTVFHTGANRVQPKSYAGGATISGGSMLSGGSMPPIKTSRVAIAGATGYTGQELLRILGRHPSVSVTAAMSSGSASGAARRLPALARIWDGQIAPLSADALARDA